MGKKVILVVLVVAVVVLIGLSLGRRPAQGPPQGPAQPTGQPGRAVDAMNATYPVGDRQVTLVNGVLDEGAVGKWQISVSATGELDGDGTDDTAVVLANTAGGKTTYYLATVLSSGNVSTGMLGEKGTFEAVAVQDRTIALTFKTSAAADPQTSLYKVEGGMLKGTKSSETE